LNKKKTLDNVTRVLPMVGLKNCDQKEYVDPKNKIEKNCSKPKKSGS
jgi:hypothetical protein